MYKKVCGGFFMPEKNKFKNVLHKSKPYIIGVLRGLGVFLAFYLLIAFIMNKTNSESALLYYLIYLFIVLGGFVCGVYVYKKVRGRGFLTGIISTIPYSLIVFIIFCLINGFSVSRDIFIVFLLSLSGGFLGGITAANTKI